MSAITQAEFIKSLRNGVKAKKTQAEWSEEMSKNFGQKADTFKQRYAALRKTYTTQIAKEQAEGKEDSVNRLNEALSLLTLPDGRGRKAAECTVESLTSFLDEEVVE